MNTSVNNDDSSQAPSVSVADANEASPKTTTLSLTVMPEDVLHSSVVDALRHGTKIRTARGFAFRAIPCGSRSGAYKFGCAPMVIGKTYWHASPWGALKALAKL